MTSRLLIGLVAFSLWAVGARWYWACQVKGWCDGKLTPSQLIAVSDAASLGGQLAEPENLQQPGDGKPAARPMTLALVKDGQPVIGGHEEFAFDFASHEPLLSSDNEHFLAAIAEHLKKNPKELVFIYGRYFKQESTSASSLYENLGLARAAATREVLVNDFATDQNQVRLDFEAVESADPTHGPQAPLLFVAKANTAPDAVSASYEFKDMTISDANFESNSDKLQPTAAFKAYTDSLVTYCKAHPKAKLTITGHTDSDGDDKHNQKLGQSRAEATKKYLKSKGVKNAIATASKGEKQPVAPNDTEANKGKNRRVNIKLKD